ncbi:MAG: DUF4982 domain-containing protein [Bacteroidales bacterium]|nr:DUF4982 domain-containing protein [Bacteroidales bacterium]
MGTLIFLLTAILLNNGWSFSLGHATQPEKDFHHFTEYFSPFAKSGLMDECVSPVNPKFDDSAWQKVNLPHDWVVDLPFSAEASHSHGYKCVGWKYPENSVGWYRRHLSVPEEDRGGQIWIEFQGIYRNSQVYCNGHLLGCGRSGYMSYIYDLSPYLNYGGDNVLTVRCDATEEEGWYYEGAGIYRNVWLHKAGPVAIEPWSLRVGDGKPEYRIVMASAELDTSLVSSRVRILDAAGTEVAAPAHLWSPSDPYLYTAEISLYYDGSLSATYTCRFGLRTIEFNGQNGFLLNGEPLKLKGCNLHLDHAGVGVGVPDELWRYRLLQLKKYGFNAIRCSHNPASPAMLDLCDELGFLVIDECRQAGVNPDQLAVLRNMIERDRNHPSVILWSVGNEEWGIEYNAVGPAVARRMQDEVHRLDPSRPATYGNCSGWEIPPVMDVPGYNYIVQNNIDGFHEAGPTRAAVGTEETSGAGTRGKYDTVPSEGWMRPLNRMDTLGRINVIEHGWQFYKERPWAAGLFYWTGQDYRGEPNPMKWPATGSQFGILDYCCYPKDEAFYIQAAWTEESVLHICGPCDGSVWVYSKCDKVTLHADGRSLGTKKMPVDGHLEWPAGKASRYTAKGYVRGRKVAVDSWPAAFGETTATLSKSALNPDGQDVVIIDVETAEEELLVSVENAQLLGWGNGNPGFKESERPVLTAPCGVSNYPIHPFSGRVQLIVRSLENAPGPATVSISGLSPITL